jgi:hypothetical protein
VKLSRALVVIAVLTTVAAAAVGSEAGARIRQSLDDKPVTQVLVSKRLVRVTLDKKAQPLRVTPARKIAAALDSKKVAYVGSGTVKRRIRHTLDDTGYLGSAEKAKPSVPTLAFPDTTTRAVPRRQRVIRQQLVEGPLLASRPRPLRTSLD